MPLRYLSIRIDAGREAALEAVEVVFDAVERGELETSDGEGPDAAVLELEDGSDFIPERTRH
jgi:hypothetical protein